MTIDVLVLLFILESVRISERSEGKLLRSGHILAVTFSVFVNFAGREYKAPDATAKEGRKIITAALSGRPPKIFEGNL